MPLIFLLLNAIAITNPVKAQFHDFTWLMGYNNAPQPVTGAGTSILRFQNLELAIDSLTESLYDFYLTNISMSDQEGNLLFYCNGIDLMNAQHELMDNGEWMLQDVVAQYWKDDGYPLKQGMTSIPYPGTDNKYLLLYTNRVNTNDTMTAHSNRLFFSTVDMSLNNGMGKVIEKKENFLYDTLDLGRLVLNRHANGRDWWMIISEWNKIAFYSFLINPDGIQQTNLQQINDSTNLELAGAGQAVFSPDGTKYARHRIVNLGNFIELYDFDRCTGVLNNFQIFEVDLPELSICGGGVAFSADSRFLYIPACHYLFRIDTDAPDPEATLELIAEYDGFQSPFNTTFYTAQLAPDGKIYINTSGGSDRLHVIHRPNLPGDAFQLEQHGIRLPTQNARSLPNFPNYRLGPIDGSPCDTLGIDNIPLAGFRVADTGLVVSFIDLSAYEPTDWFWTFGDAYSSAEQWPMHSYQNAGTYKVCQTVSNAYGEDTWCRDITVQEPVGVWQVERSGIRLDLAPNPTSGTLRITWEEALPGAGQFRLVDPLGRVLQSFDIAKGQPDLWIDLSAFPTGIYLGQLYVEGTLVSAGKILHQ